MSRRRVGGRAHARRSGFADVGSGRANRTGFGAGASRSRAIPAPLLFVPLMALVLAAILLGHI